MPKLKPLPASPWRKLKDRAHAAQHYAACLYGKPLGGMLTDLTLQGRPVIFLHNPKTGGTSLGKFLHVKRRSHNRPAHVLSEKSWLNCFSIVVVRHPFERFLSSYYHNILRGNENSLVRRYGPAVNQLSAFEFLDLLSEVKNTGPQVNWAHYPSATKPHADLILRFENIQSWKSDMLALGLDVGARDLPHANKSERAMSDHLDRLGLSLAEFERLEARVREHFAMDYLAFGYQ